MILAVDIGNTNVSLGVFSEAGEIIYKSSLPDNAYYLSGEWMRAFQSKLLSIGTENIEGAVIASVVPEINENILPAIKNLVKGRVIEAGFSLPHYIDAGNYDKRLLGADRVCDVIAAVKLYGAPVAVFDLGTATTLSVADAKGAFLGGMIIPGVRLSVDSLSSRAALLPFIELSAPDKLLGTDTASCMVNGAVYGTAAVIDGIGKRLDAEHGTQVITVLTGGAGELIMPHINRKVIYDKDLQLKGLKILYDMNI